MGVQFGDVGKSAEVVVIGEVDAVPCRNVENGADVPLPVSRRPLPQFPFGVDDQRRAGKGQQHLGRLHPFAATGGTDDEGVAAVVLQCGRRHTDDVTVTVMRCCRQRRQRQSTRLEHQSQTACFVRSQPVLPPPVFGTIYLVQLLRPCRLLQPPDKSQQRRQHTPQAHKMDEKGKRRQGQCSHTLRLLYRRQQRDGRQRDKSRVVKTESVAGCPVGWSADATDTRRWYRRQRQRQTPRRRPRRLCPPPAVLSLESVQQFQRNIVLIKGLNHEEPESFPVGEIMVTAQGSHIIEEGDPPV